MPPIWLTFSKIRVPRKEPKSKTIASRTSDPQRDPAQHLGVPCARRRRIAHPQGPLEKALHNKFNNPRLAQLLLFLDTGDDHLVYSDDSTYWGDHNSKGGQNHMGKQLMYVRSQLRLSVSGMSFGTDLGPSLSSGRLAELLATMGRRQLMQLWPQCSLVDLLVVAHFAISSTCVADAARNTMTSRAMSMRSG